MKSSKALYATSLFLAVCLMPGAGSGAPTAQEPAVRNLGDYVWDLSSLCAGDAAWERDRATVLRQIESIAQFKGTVGRSAGHLADALDAVYDVRSRAARMAIYGLLLVELDTGSAMAKAREDAGSTLERQVESAVEFVEHEVRAIDGARIERWLREEPRLGRHRRRINRIRFEAPHSLGAEAQAVLESMPRWPQLAGDTFWMLHESDLGWPTVRNEDGDKETLGLSGYLQARRWGDREARASAVRAYLNRLRTLESAFGLLLTRRIEADLTIARHRRFDDGIEAIWYLRDGMPRRSHRVTIDVARRNFTALHRYADLRRRAFGLERVTYLDLFTEIRGADRTFTIDDAMRIAVEASAPLGAEYQARLRERLAMPWMHLAPSPKKRGSYAIFPPVGGAHPHFLMSYRPTYRHSRAVAGAVTLMMAFADIPPDRVPETRDDPGIYSNAVIYVGDMLHDDHLIARSTDRRERIAYLINAIDLLASHYYRWVLTSELDGRVQDLIAAGDPPSGAKVSQIYLELLREYYGHDKGVVDVDEAFAAEWMTASVPFSTYEHQFWPPAVAAACLTVERLGDGDASAQRFHELLGRGELDLSYQLFREIGIDLASPAPYEAVVRRMNRLMDELEGTLDDRG